MLKRVWNRRTKSVPQRRRIHRRNAFFKSKPPERVFYSKERVALGTELKNVKPPKSSSAKPIPQPRFPSLTENFFGVKDKELQIETLPPAKTEVSTLPNGVRVVTEEFYGQISAVGLIAKCGSRFEKPENMGVSYLLERLQYKSTTQRSVQEITELIEYFGANVTAIHDRENIYSTVEVLRDYTPQAVEILCETCTKPAFNQEEIDEQIESFEAEIEDVIENDDKGTIQQILHSVAYAGDPLGYSNFDAHKNFPNLTRETLLDFHAENFVGNRVILTGTSIEHEKLVDLAKQHLSHIPAGGRHPNDDPKAKYTGGQCYDVFPPKKEYIEPKDYFAIGFEAPGWDNTQDGVVLAVLSKLLGGGDSFSSGGPGKGMHSRLNLDLIHRYAIVESAEAVLSSQTDTSLFGISAGCTPGNLKELIPIVVNFIINLVNSVKHAEFEAQLQRAKNQLKSAMFLFLEQRVSHLEDLGRQVICFNKRHDPDTVCQMIDAVTSDDCLRLLLLMLKSRPSVVVLAQKHRHLVGAPSYDIICGALAGSLATFFSK